MRATRSLTTLAVLAALASTTACGSDDASTGSSGTPTTSAPSGTTSEPTDSPAATTSDICTVVTDDEISGIIGKPVTREEVPGGGCTFNQEDPRATSISLGSDVYDEANGGFDGAVTGMTAQFEGAAGAEVAGVGERAYTKTGTTMGGSNTQGGGLVLVNGVLVQVTLIQGEGLSAAKVTTLLVDTLKLTAGKL